MLSTSYFQKPPVKSSRHFEISKESKPTRGDMVRRQTYEDVLRQEFFTDPIVVTFLSRLGEHTGLKSSAERLHAVYVQERMAATISHRLKEEDMAFFNACVEQAPMIAEFFMLLTQDMFGASYPMLAAEACMEVRARLWSQAYGQNIQRAETLQFMDPNPDHNFQIDPTLSTAEKNKAVKRFKEQSRKNDGNLRGRVPKNKLEAHRQYARWYYRHIVKHEEIMDLARELKGMAKSEYRVEEAGTYIGRRLIQYGIDRVADTLGLPSRPLRRRPLLK